MWLEQVRCWVRSMRRPADPSSPMPHTCSRLKLDTPAARSLPSRTSCSSANQLQDVEVAWEQHTCMGDAALAQACRPSVCRSMAAVPGMWLQGPGTSHSPCAFPRPTSPAARLHRFRAASQLSAKHGETMRSRDATDAPVLPSALHALCAAAQAAPAVRVVQQQHVYVLGLQLSKGLGKHLRQNSGIGIWPDGSSMSR